MQLLQIGRSSPHFILRRRQVRQPVFVRLRSFAFAVAEDDEGAGLFPPLFEPFPPVPVGVPLASMPGLLAQQPQWSCEFRWF